MMLFHMHLMAAHGGRLVRNLEHIGGDHYYVAWLCFVKFRWGYEAAICQALSTKTTIKHTADTRRPTWSPMDGVRDSKGANLVPDHIIQLLLQLRCGLGALGQDHVGIDALPLDVMVNPVVNNNNNKNNDNSNNNNNNDDNNNNNNDNGQPCMPLQL